MKTEARRPRDPSLDVLRGWAIVLMITSHVGLGSHLGAVVNLPYFIDPAGPFVLLSGLVLGMGVRDGKPASRAVRRGFELLVIHVALMVVVLAVHETTGRLRAPSVVEAGGLVAVAWKLPTLRLQALDFMNILPLFVVFFLVSPMLVLSLRRGVAFASLVGMSSVALWAVTQRFPGWFRFTDSAVGPEAFVLPAWQLPFVIGLSVGYFRKRGEGRSFPVPLLVGFGAVFAVCFVIGQFQRTFLAKFGLVVPPELAFLFEKSTWGPARAAYTLSALGLGYEGCRRIFARGGAAARILAPLELLGRKSLYCFLVHLPFALAASALFLDARGRFVQDLASALVVLVVYGMAKQGVLANVIPS